MSDLFDKSIRTLELPPGAGAAERAGGQRRGQTAGPAPAAGDGAGGGAAAAGPDRRGPEFDRPAGQPVLFRREAGGGGPGPGGPGRRPEHPGAADHRRPADRRPPGQGVFQRRGGGEDRHRPPVPLPPRQPLSGGEDQAGHPGRGHHRRRRQHGAGGHPPPHAGGPGQEPPDPPADHLLPQLREDPAGDHHHPAGRPLRGAGEGGAQGRPAGAGPRHLLHRRHAVRGAHGRGPGQQRVSSSSRPRSRRRSTASWRSSPPRPPPTGRTSSGTTTPWSTWT